MADIRPFCAVRPDKDYASKIGALPYDVYDRQSALAQVTKEPMSFLHIDRPETWFDASVDMYASKVYEKAGQVLLEWIQKGCFVQDDRPCYYIYEEIMDGRSQAGIVACASVNDYLDQVIKKHENTREEKEQDRIRHIEACKAQTGPIFLAYREEAALSCLMATAMSRPPVYDFTAADGVIQRVWIIDDSSEIELICRNFSKIQSIYIADGHHRAASAVKVSLKRRQALGLKENQPAGDESDYFLCVLFPDTNLKIMPYNRIVKDLHGLTPTAFLNEISKFFDIIALPEGTPKEQSFPEKKGAVGMYLSGRWYRLCKKGRTDHTEAANGETANGEAAADVVKALDVSLLQDELLEPVLGIKDARLDSRIDFVGGIHGLGALEDYCDKKGWAVAFAMYPTSIDELFAVADAGALMPPKSTWFEPKLLSGLFIHKIGE